MNASVNDNSFFAYCYPGIIVRGRSLFSDFDPRSVLQSLRGLYDDAVSRFKPRQNLHHIANAAPTSTGVSRTRFLSRRYANVLELLSKIAGVRFLEIV